MNSREFVYWLQGMFELAEPKSLDERQTDLIKRHLAMVFIHEIDPSYPATQQAVLDAAHVGSDPTPTRPHPVPSPSGTVLYRC